MLGEVAGASVGGTRVLGDLGLFAVEIGDPRL